MKACRIINLLLVILLLSSCVSRSKYVTVDYDKYTLETLSSQVIDELAKGVSGKDLHPIERDYRNDCRLVEQAFDFLKIHDNTSFLELKEELQILFNTTNINAVLNQDSYTGTVTSRAVDFNILDMKGQFLPENNKRTFLVHLKVVDLRNEQHMFVYKVSISNNKVTEFERIL